MKKLFWIVLITLLGVQVSTAEEEARLLRFPAIYEDQVVFNFAGLINCV